MASDVTSTILAQRMELESRQGIIIYFLEIDLAVFQSQLKQPCGTSQCHSILSSNHVQNAANSTTSPVKLFPAELCCWTDMSVRTKFMFGHSTKMIRHQISKT